MDAGASPAVAANAAGEHQRGERRTLKQLQLADRTPPVDAVLRTIGVTRAGGGWRGGGVHFLKCTQGATGVAQAAAHHQSSRDSQVPPVRKSLQG